MDKKKFVLRMDDDLYNAIEKWAADEFRSVNGQIEWMLHQAVRHAGRVKSKAEAKAKDEAPSTTLGASEAKEE